jgi:hypothetical protein
MMSSASDPLAGTKAGALTGGNPLDILASMQFWTYAIFYILMFLTGIFIAGCSYGYIIDRNDFVSQLEEQLVGLPRDADIRGLEELIPGKIIDDADDDVVLDNPEDYVAHKGAFNRKLAAASLKGGPVIMGREGVKILDVDEQSRLKKQNE